MSMDEVRLDFAMSLGVCYVSECDRCLEEVEVPFDLSIVQKLVAPDRADQDALEEQEAFMEGYSLNIDSLIR